MSVCFFVCTDCIHDTCCGTSCSFLHTIVGINVSSLCDSFSSCTATKSTYISSYTVSFASSLLCNFTCLFVLNILTVSASTLISMILIVLIGMRVAMCYSLKHSYYCKVRCNICEFLIPACEIVMICFIVILCGRYGSISVLTADNALSCIYFTIYNKCYCVNLKCTVVVIKSLKELCCCCINN